MKNKRIGRLCSARQTENVNTAAGASIFAEFEITVEPRQTRASVHQCLGLGLSLTMFIYIKKIEGNITFPNMLFPS